MWTVPVLIQRKLLAISVFFSVMTAQCSALQRWDGTESPDWRWLQSPFWVLWWPYEREAGSPDQTQRWAPGLQPVWESHHSPEQSNRTACHQIRLDQLCLFVVCMLGISPPRIWSLTSDLSSSQFHLETNSDNAFWPKANQFGASSILESNRTTSE